MASDRLWNVYLAGEIHSDWREKIVSSCKDRSLPVRLTGPELDHAKSDRVGTEILGEESSSFWHDHKAAKINAIRTRSVLGYADIVVVKFGEKYRQWNAAFDAGQAVALHKSLVVIHPEDFDHALKEVDAQALAVARDESQVVEILAYITSREF